MASITGDLSWIETDSDFHLRQGLPPSLKAASGLRNDTDVNRPSQFCWEAVRLNNFYFIVNLFPVSSFYDVQFELSSDRVGSGVAILHSTQAISRALGPVASGALSTSIFTIILPATSGYNSRSDFFHVRMQGCPWVVSVRDCLRPLERYSDVWTASMWLCQTAVLNSDDDLLGLIQHATGIVEWASPSSPALNMKQEIRLPNMVEELRCRLNVAHLCPQPLARKRVALVRGRPNITAGSPVYFAAQALGISLVIVDEAGHWLQWDTEYNKTLREAFLATDMTEDAGVADRIIETLKGYPLPIDGIFTLSDNFFVSVAKVAVALGLPTCPVSAFETSVDKYLSRMLQASPGSTAKVGSLSELQDLMRPAGDSSGSQGQFTPSFPAVVKPTKGWSSECVSKVSNLQDLTVAVVKATGRHGGSAVIEPFLDGPEIDANFILLDGEILFCEISDEQPCAADASSATVHDNFSSVALTLPSALPVEEQESSKTTLGEILVNLGFRTGVFHVEARILNSRYEYRELDNSVVDIMAKAAAEAPTEMASCRLIEINARPPGYRVTLASKHTYGVDFFAAHILAAVGDTERLRLVAHPFGSWAEALGRTGGSQCWARLVFIRAPAAGIVRSDQPCEELKRRRPDLARYIVTGVDYYQPGDRVNLSTDGATTFVAHVLVSSRKGRLDAVMVGEEVRRSYKIDIVRDD